MSRFTYKLVELEVNSVFEQLDRARSKAYNAHCTVASNQDQLTEIHLKDVTVAVKKLAEYLDDLHRKTDRLKQEMESKPSDRA